MPNPEFMRLFDADYLRNFTKYRHNYNEILIGKITHAPLKVVTSNDLE